MREYVRVINFCIIIIIIIISSSSSSSSSSGNSTWTIATFTISNTFNDV